MLHNFRTLKWLAEARPAATGIEFVEGTEQWIAGNDVDVESVLMIIPEFVVKSGFGRGFLGDAVLEGIEMLLQFVW